jgi:hypothetical protein
LERNSNCSPCRDDNSHCCAKKVCREREPEPEREAEQPVYEPEFEPLEDADATDDEHGSVVVPEVEDDDAMSQSLLRTTIRTTAILTRLLLTTWTPKTRANARVRNHAKCAIFAGLAYPPDASATFLPRPPPRGLIKRDASDRLTLTKE